MLQGNLNLHYLLRRRRYGRVRGFSLVELSITMAIVFIMLAIAIPHIQSMMYYYQLQAAVTSSTWAIQSTRYQAIMQGYPFQVAFTTSNNQFQVQSSPSNNGTYANVGSAVPISAQSVVLSANTTYQFKPNGYVTPTVGGLTYTITYQGRCQKVTVTNYANITLGAIGATCP